MIDGLNLGILTSGGDAPGMNAVVAGACEQVERLGGRALGIHAGFAGLAGRDAEPITSLQARDHMHEPGTWLGTSRWPLLREPEGRLACRDAIEALALSGLLVIGGNGSTNGARALADAVPVAVVPATIDRDLEGTDLTIGTDSAIGYAMDAIDRLRITGRSLPGRAFVLQTLGAPNGFLADAVATAAGIDDVLVPERPFDLDAIGRRPGRAVGQRLGHRRDVRGRRRCGPRRGRPRESHRAAGAPDDPRARPASRDAVGARSRPGPGRRPRRRQRARRWRVVLHRPHTRWSRRTRAAHPGRDAFALTTSSDNQGAIP